jgi:hypothetical protein
MSVIPCKAAVKGGLALGYQDISTWINLTHDYPVSAARQSGRTDLSPKQLNFAPNHYMVVLFILACCQR